MISKPVVALGALAAAQAHHVHCPFGHDHDITHYHNTQERPFFLRTILSWGILGEIASSDEQTTPVEDVQKEQDSSDDDSHHHHKEYKCPIKQWFEDRKEKHEEKVEEWKEYKEKHQCPFMKFFKDKVEIAQHQETFESPFFDPESVQETAWDKTKTEGTPTAVFHGLGDACIYGGMKSFTDEISAGTNAPAHCIEVGLPSIGEMFGNFETIAKKSCEQVAKNPDFQGEFNVVGLSQGGLLARYIVEECEMKGTVRNMLTLGGPHMGVDAVPNCNEGFFCGIVNTIAKKIVYHSHV